jgi:GNAT superfamily N-acetyltransferase
MHWYDKLNQYFPIEEMKSQEHMETLLRERGDIYHKDEGPHHVLIYIELEDFLFIDYVYVAAAARGQGIGRRLLEKLKAKNKPIILEVEPLDYDDSDSEKRRRFYEREGFQQARAIGYRRRSLATDRVNPLEILFWSPQALSEETVLCNVMHTYETIHTYKDQLFYGRSYQPAKEVFTFDASRAAPLEKAA